MNILFSAASGLIGVVLLMAVNYFVSNGKNQTEYKKRQFEELYAPLYGILISPHCITAGTDKKALIWKCLADNLHLAPKELIRVAELFDSYLDNEEKYIEFYAMVATGFQQRHKKLSDLNANYDVLSTKNLVRMSIQTFAVYTPCYISIILLYIVLSGNHNYSLILYGILSAAMGIALGAFIFYSKSRWRLKHLK